MTAFFIDVIMPVLIVMFSWWIVYIYSLIRVKLVEIELYEQSLENESEVLGIYVERVGNQVLVYNLKTNRFLTQVKTKDELFQFFQDHDYYSTLNVVIGEDNMNEVFGENHA